MQLDVESLRVLLAVLDTGGMTSAARQLHLSQSAVSRKVSRLEERAGQPLLIRDGHTLRPTRAARELLPDARAMVKLHDGAVARLESSDLEGTVRLSANGEVDIAQIATVLGVFKRRHPGAEVDFSVDNSGSLTTRIDNAEIDVALFQVSDESLRADDVVLWSEELLFVSSASDDHSTQPIPFLDFDCCFYNEHTHAALGEAGIEFKTVFSAATSATVRAAVQAGIGVAAMSSSYIGGDVVEWKPPAEVGELPQIHQVLRTVPGEPSDVLAALVDTIRAELETVKPKRHGAAVH
jgi:DNA-binding transcriptional LysR family regulator